MADTDRPEQPPVLPWARAAAGPRVTAASAIAAGLPYRGELSEDAPLRLLYLVAAAAASGRLELATERGQFVLQFRRGLLEAATSDAAVDGLGAHLVRRGAISPEALARAEGLRPRFAGDLVSALVSLDAFRPARDLGLLQEHGVLVVAKAIGADRGASEWAPGAAAAPGFPLASRWGLVCEAARRLDPDDARQLLGDRTDRVASRTRGRVDVAELKLTPQEARIASLFDGRTTIGRLVAARAPDTAMILRTAFLLAHTELLQFGETVAAASPTPAPAPRRDRYEREGDSATARTAHVAPTTAAATPPAAIPLAATVAGPSPASPEKAPPAATAPGEDGASLAAFHGMLAGADHFEVLGAKRDATAAQLKAAYFQLAKRYHPDAGAPGEPPEWKKLRADIFARIGEAWGVLGNDQARAAYLEERASSAGAPVDVAHIVRAEELFRKATVLVRARQYAQGQTALEQAIQVNPDEPEFHVWLAWTRFLLAHDRAAQRVASGATVEAALEKAPRCAFGYLFLAQMARLEGDMTAAERHLKRGLAAVPHHEELARELRFIEQKHPRK